MYLVDPMNRFEYIKSVYSIPSNKAMLAVVQDKPGDPDVLYLGQVDKPTLGDNDVLIKVYNSNKCLRMSSITKLTENLSGGLGVCQPS